MPNVSPRCSQRLIWSAAVTLLALGIGPACVAQQHLVIRAGIEDTLPDSPGFGQAKATAATISGLITDVNGGIVPGATIYILDTDGKPARHATADPEGRFLLEALPPGTYRLRIDAEGLQSFEPPLITLRDAQRFELPATALPIAATREAVSVVVTREEIAEEELDGQTKQRVLGILPNFYTSYVWNAAPLTTRQKFKLTLRATTDPFVFIRTGITAGIQQANNTYPEYGGGAGGYAQRYAAAYGDALVGRFISSAILPSVFHQDPRYFYRGTGGIPHRALHALVSAVAARSDGGRVEPNYTHTLGDFLTGYLSRTWHPGSDNGVTLAVDNMLIGIADSAGHNLLQEFLYKRISRGTPPFAKGKPPEEQESAAHP